MADPRQAMDVAVRSVTELLGGTAGLVPIALLVGLLIGREGARAAAGDGPPGPLMPKSVSAVTWALVLVVALVVGVRLREAITG